MTDLKISKKHHPTGSLSRRILLVSIFLMVIPLFVQNFLLYLQEYREKLADVEEELTIVAKERAHFAAILIEMSWNILELKPENAISGDPEGNVKRQYTTPKTGAVFGDPEGNVKRQYTTPKTGAVFGDPEGNVKRLYIERIPLPQGVEEEFVLVTRSRDALLVGKKESATSALVVRIPMGILVADVPRTLPVHIQVIGKEGTRAEGEIGVQEAIPGTELKVEVTAEKRAIHGLHLQSYYFHFATLLFFVGVVGGGAVYFFTRRISRPLKDLCKTMQRVSEGAIHARYKKDWMGFEINELGLQFNEALDGWLRHAQEAERERIQRERLAEEFRIGHQIQASLLPSHVPGLGSSDMGTGYFAAKEVNGDFYDLFRLEDGKLLIAVGDAAGKGISACLFSLGLRSMIRALATAISDLSELVRKVNDLYLIDAHSLSMFSTLWLGIYDPEKRHLSFCSQGHPPALLRRKGRLEELGTGGIALGAQKLDVIETKEVLLEKGDLLLIYSDGVIEAHDPDQQLFGRGRLNEFLLRRKNDTAQQTVDRLIEEIHLFSQGAPQHDDITLIILNLS